MPGQVRKTRRSCKDMSETIQQQETINFPQRRATRAVSSPAVERKSYSLRSPAPIKKNLVENDSQVVLEVLPYFIIKSLMLQQWLQIFRERNPHNPVQVTLGQILYELE